jgi:hypothetical protein
MLVAIKNTGRQNMKTITSPLFQPFAITEHPVRYFIFFFLMALGVVHLASDISRSFFNGIFVDGPQMTLMVLLLSILISVSRYYEQKKERSKTTNRIAT